MIPSLFLLRGIASAHYPRSRGRQRPVIRPHRRNVGRSVMDRPVTCSMKRDHVQRLADEDLMTLVDRKDETAFEVFYERHGGPAYSLAHRIVGDRNLAEDVVQEAFLSIWRSKAGYDRARGSVRSWSLGIVRNRAIDALRRSSTPAPKLDLDDDATLEAAARLGHDRLRGHPPRDRPPGARRARRASERAVAGDRARLLRRLQPLRDRRHAGRAAGHDQGQDAPGAREGACDLAEGMAVREASEVLP